MSFPFQESLSHIPQAHYAQPGFPPTASYHPVPRQAHVIHGVYAQSSLLSDVQIRNSDLEATRSDSSFSGSSYLVHSVHEQHHVGLGNNPPAEFTMPVEPMGPPSQLRKRKAPTLRDHDWEPYKARILQLHIKEGHSLPIVKKKIEAEFGFKAELRQYRSRVSKWGKDKNVKSKEMKAIVRKRLKRNLVETSKRGLAFEVRGKPVQEQKIERWMRDHHIFDSSLYPLSPAAPTPPDVKCHTISERGSPALISVHSPATPSFTPTRSLQMSSPALSISSPVPPQGSTFTGQSPTLTYRSLTNLGFDQQYIENIQGSHMEYTQRRYRQDEEEHLRIQIGRTNPTGSSEPLVNLGHLLFDQGRYKAAEDIARKHLEDLQSRDRDDRIRVEILDALNLLARVVAVQGKYNEAERLYSKVLHGREKLIGMDHRDTIISRRKLAQVLSFKGKYEEAEVMHRRTLEMTVRLFGSEDLDTLMCLDALGITLLDRGKYKEAEQHHRRALGTREMVFGTEHRDTLVSVSSLGVALSRQGKYDEAELCHRRALEAREKTFGSEHPGTIESLYHLASALSGQGRYEDAESIRRRVLEAQEKVLGTSHPSTLGNLGELGVLLARQGKYDEAEEAVRGALEEQERLLGIEPLDTVFSFKRLGYILSRQRRYEEAEALLQRALEGFEKVLGRDHPDTLAVTQNLAWTLKRQGRHQEAMSLIENCSQAALRVLGPDHPLTKGSLEMLNNWKRDVGQSPTWSDFIIWQ